MLDILKRKCRVCGCTEMQACPDGCYWTEADLCSACTVGDEDIDSVVAGNGGVGRVARERLRQLAEENYSVEGDLHYTAGELGAAAACYAMPQALRDLDGFNLMLIWPWSAASWKPSPATVEGRIRELEKAGALIAAEIDRLLVAGSL
jgi:hypothetical protein